MSEIRVRIPQVQNARVALAIYYSKSEIGNADIKMLFGNMGQERTTKLKAVARERMREANCPTYNARYVNTECAFDAWGIDVKRLTKGLGILEKLGLEVKMNEGI